MVEFKICNECGCMSYNENVDKYTSTNFYINSETLELENENNYENFNEESMVIECSECESENLENIELDKGQLKDIINLDDQDRLEWLKKYLIIRELEDAKLG